MNVVKNILITGGAGFIGSHLCNYLVNSEENVICLDNLISGSEKNIAHLLPKNNFTFVKWDVTKIIDTKKFRQIDQIFHLASPADPNVRSPVSYMSHPFETMSVNTTGSWNMCELALKKNAKLLFASTSEIYGDPKVSPQGESYRGNVSTTGPRSVYDESKRFGETIVSAFVREKSLNGRIVRIFNTYGPKMNPNEGRAVVNFINQSIRNIPITIYGSGKQTRSFCYIDDLIDGLEAAMNKSQQGEVYNLGNSDEKTILEFANIIRKISKSKSKVIFSQNMPEDDPAQRKPDITKAKKLLGWEPKIKLEEGLTETIKYFQSVL